MRWRGILRQIFGRAKKLWQVTAAAAPRRFSRILFYLPLCRFALTWVIFLALIFLFVRVLFLLLHHLIFLMFFLPDHLCFVRASPAGGLVVNRASRLSLPCGRPSLTQRQHRLAAANGRAATTAGDKATGAKDATAFRRVGYIHPSGSVCSSRLVIARVAERSTVWSAQKG